MRQGQALGTVITVVLSSLLAAGSAAAQPPPSPSNGLTFDLQWHFRMLDAEKRWGIDRGPVELPSGPDFNAPNGRPSVVVPTWQFAPGTDLVNAVLSSLGYSASVTPIDAVLQQIDFDDEARWSLGGGARKSIGESRLAAYATLLYRQGITDPDAIRAAIEQTVDETATVFVEDLFSGAAARNATGTVTSSGGHSGAFSVSGGLESTIGSLGGFLVTVNAGAVFTTVLGDPLVTGIRFDYGFTAGSLPIQESDQVDLTFRSSGGVGVEAGLNFVRPLNGRAELVLGVGLVGQRSGLEIVTSTHPDSVAGAQPGAVAFSTPPGTPTIVFSTIPTVPTSLSGVVTDHVLLSQSWFRWSPQISVGIRF